MPTATESTAAPLVMRDVLALIRDGSLPPPGAAATLGLQILDLGDGRATFGLTPAPEHLNTDGAVNGGVLATLADFALCCAVNDVPATTVVSTGNLSLAYQRPVTLQTGPVRAVATVLHRTARTALVEATICDAEGRLHAHATATVLTRAAQA